jgi:hypothetical protein
LAVEVVEQETLALEHKELVVMEALVVAGHIFPQAVQVLLGKVLLEVLD